MSLRAGWVVFWRNIRVPPTSPYRIELTIEERAALVALVRPTGQARMWLRTRIVLAAADGASNAGVARELGVCEDTVRKWRRRYGQQPGLAGLVDAPRCGRPPRFSAVQRAQVTALACELPASRGMPLSRWSSFEWRVRRLRLEPSLVLEVLAAEVTPASNYTAGRGLLGGAGLGLRFPRFTGRWRDDKTAEDATTTAEIVQMYRAARQVPEAP